MDCEGFDVYWDDPAPYNARSFLFKHPTGDTLTKLQARAGVTLELLGQFLDESIILCRTCAGIARSQQE